jgi:2',3'-cyclic-nucleotide 2'-phosphodiesterase (5'-nucleotidase family)
LLFLQNSTHILCLLYWVQVFGLLIHFFVHKSGQFYTQSKGNPDKVCDISLAKATKNIDLIIGGHTHTFLDKPTTEINSVGKRVLVNQVGCYGLYLGQVDFIFEKSQLSRSEAAAILI